MIFKKGRRADSIRQHLVTHTNPDSAISDQFRTIRSNIAFLTAEKQKKVFLITSSSTGEGKSTTTANLAVSMSGQKERILVIDANIRKPALHYIFTLQNELGLSDILTNKATLKETICQTDIGKLDILPSGSTLYNPAELFGNEAMKQLLIEVKETYDVILIDSPTVLQSTETRLLANLCDRVILVVNRGKTMIENAMEARRILELSQADLMGTIMNEK